MNYDETNLNLQVGDYLATWDITIENDGESGTYDEQSYNQYKYQILKKIKNDTGKTVKTETDDTGVLIVVVEEEDETR